MTRTLSIAIKENTYQDLKQKIGVGKISSFVNKAVEKELSELEKKEQQQREELRQKLIAGYKANARNKRLQKELRILEEMSLEDVSKISQRSKKKSDEQKN